MNETVLFTLLKSQEIWLLEVKQRALQNVGCTAYRFCEMGEMREMIQSDDLRGLNHQDCTQVGLKKNNCDLEECISSICRVRHCEVASSSPLCFTLRLYVLKLDRC